MKLSGKLLIAPLVAIGFLVTLACAGFYALTLQQAAADNFYQGIFSRYEAAVQTETAVGKVHAGIYRLLNLSESMGADRAAQEAAAYKKQLTVAQDHFKKLVGRNAEEQKQVQAAGAKLAE
jgi:hypothetical protein